LPASLVVPGFERGARIVRAAGRDVQTMADVRRAIVDATSALAAGQQMSVEIASVGPAGGGGEPVVRELSVDFAQASALRALGWEAGPVLDCFRLAEVDVRASGTLQALAMGLVETRRVVAKTYLTFLRLYQGSVPVSQLQGPVGITHLGSRVAERGWVYLIFYLALISANLAVINFLPLPIVDGGHMVFLAIEGITKKPVSAAVQNVATIAGLVLIGSMFLMVTFNDLVRLFG
jgi:regulator of sigma E protease